MSEGQLGLKATMSEGSADTSASKDYCVLVNHAFADRVQQALGGRIVGDLEPSHQRLCSLRLATIGSSSPASLMAMGRKEVSRALRVPHAARTFDEAIAGICAAVCAAADPAEALGPLPLLRIDTVPKAGFGDATSAAILAAAAALGPGGDALELTRSASKAVLVVNLVRLSDADFRWGVVVNPNPSPSPNPSPNPNPKPKPAPGEAHHGRGLGGALPVPHRGHRLATPHVGERRHTRRVGRLGLG